MGRLIISILLSYSVPKMITTKFLIFLTTATNTHDWLRFCCLSSQTCVIEAELEASLDLRNL